MPTFQSEIEGRPLIIETGKIAEQANGSVVVRMGDTMVLCAVTAALRPKEGRDFFPLTVEYRERTYAAGLIPGGFFKREGRPTEKEVLSSRLIDRPIRPLFPDDFMNEVQVFAQVISFDQENDGDVLGMVGSAAALSISDIPWNGPFGAIRIGKIGDNYIANPTLAQREESSMDMVIAGNADDIVMVEGHTKEISEQELLGALEFAKPILGKITDFIKLIANEIGKPDMEYSPLAPDEVFVSRVTEMAGDKLKDIITIKDKKERRNALAELKENISETLSEEFPDDITYIGEIVENVAKQEMRRKVIEQSVRLDGRAPGDIRPITVEVGLLPRAHGSALFTRGETQSLTAVTLGTKLDEQMIENLEGESWKSFMLHYNFPPYSVGEVRPIRGPSRREIGHGHLAESAIAGILPADDIFPYTIRVVSDITESNGSSSMATVCAGTLSLMDAGVPIKSPVAGIAMGLIKEGEKYVVLSDIMGEEDHWGDMDFKVAGTTDGITAFQMDVKVPGIPLAVMKEALEQAKSGREHILGKMNDVISRPRTELSAYAPRIETLYVPRDKIGDVIGPGGKVIRGLQEETGTKISIDDDGKVVVASISADGMDEAVRKIKALTASPEVGKIYDGLVKSIMPYGAFVEILPGTDGLLHISEIDFKRTERVEDVLKLGDTVRVKVIALEGGKIRLSRKAVLAEEHDRK